MCMDTLFSVQRLESADSVSEIGASEFRSLEGRLRRGRLSVSNTRILYGTVANLLLEEGLQDALCSFGSL